jgi:hypothetical protein
VLCIIFAAECDATNNQPGVRFRVVVFSATFNNILVISWWSVLLVEATKVRHCFRLKLIPKIVALHRLGLKFVECAIPGEKVKRKADTEDSAGIQINSRPVCD